MQNTLQKEFANISPSFCVKEHAIFIYSKFKYNFNIWIIFKLSPLAETFNLNHQLKVQNCPQDENYSNFLIFSLKNLKTVNLDCALLHVVHVANFLWNKERRACYTKCSKQCMY